MAGVLIVGGAAVFGLTKIGESGNESQQRAAQSSSNGTTTARTGPPAAGAGRR